MDIFDIYSSDLSSEELALEYDITTDDVEAIKTSPDDFIHEYNSKQRPLAMNKRDIVAIFMANPLVSNECLASRYDLPVLTVSNIRHSRTFRRVTRGLRSPFVGVTLLLEGTTKGREEYQELHDDRICQEHKNDGRNGE